MLHSTRRVSGGILWANLHLLFWRSLFPFTTAWMGENHLTVRPRRPRFTASYCSWPPIAYYVLQRRIIAQQGPNSLLAAAVGRDWKGKLSPLCYLTAIPSAFASPWLANALYVFVALLWLVPDRRIERVLAKRAE